MSRTFLLGRALLARHASRREAPDLPQVGPRGRGIHAREVADALLRYARGTVSESLTLDPRPDAMKIRCHLVEALAYLRIPFVIGLADAFERAGIRQPFQRLFADLADAERHAFDNPTQVRQDREAFLDRSAALLARWRRSA